MFTIISSSLIYSQEEETETENAESSEEIQAAVSIPSKDRSLFLRNVRIAPNYQIYSYAETENKTYPIINMVGFFLSSRILDDLDVFFAGSWQLQKASYPLNKWGLYQLGAEYRIIGKGFESMTFYPAAFASIDYISLKDEHEHHDSPVSASTISFSPGIGLEVYFPKSIFMTFEFGVSIFEFPQHTTGPLYRVRMAAGYHLSIEEKEVTSSGKVIEKRVELVLKNGKSVTGVIVRENNINIVIRLDSLDEVLFLRENIEEIIEN